MGARALRVDAYNRCFQRGTPILGRGRGMIFNLEIGNSFLVSRLVSFFFFNSCLIFAQTEIRTSLEYIQIEQIEESNEAFWRMHGIIGCWEYVDETVNDNFVDLRARSEKRHESGEKGERGAECTGTLLDSSRPRNSSRYPVGCCWFNSVPNKSAG